MTICSFPMCGKPIKTKVSGLCEAHLRQQKLGQPLRPRRATVKKICKHGGCESVSRSAGYCAAHYNQFWRHGYTYGKGSPKNCAVQDCGRPVERRGLCGSHIKYGLDAEIRGTQKICAVSYCNSFAQSTKKGLCEKHGLRQSRFKISTEKLLSLLELPGCEACGQPGEDLDIHHDHRCCPTPGRSCGRCVVAYLCGPCNRSAGQVGDDPERLRKIARLLEDRS